MPRRLPPILAALLLTAAFALPATPAAGKNIDLSTVPPRRSVQLTIYNAEDLTLVRETRSITFKKGVNPLQFSWANTLIDPTSVRLEFRDHADRLDVLDTTFPHDKPHMLYWNVRSDYDGEATVQISYFTSGISWAADYVGVANPEETDLTLTGYVTVTNHSGEDYENAHIRLVVGTINLVEQIKMLAQRGMERPQAFDASGPYPPTASKAGDRYQQGQALKSAIQTAEAAARNRKPKQIVKEGLSEYFIFSIEGTETVPDQWAKRLRSFVAKDAPFRIQYRYRPREYGKKLVRLYLLKNNDDAHLGQSPLPDGTVRLFQRTGDRGLRYLTQQSIDYVPIGDDIELNLGPDPDVVFDLKPLRVFRDNLWLLMITGPDILRRADAPGIRFTSNASIAGWDEHTVYVQHIANFTAKPIDVQVRRTLSGDAAFKSRLSPTRHDVNTVQFTTMLKPAQKADLPFEVIQHQGDNAEQTRVTIQQGDPALPAWAKQP